ncbi:putative transposase for insertion sequence element IS231B (plasmid) [Bacillus cereus E33L]|uniref:Possible IS231-related transposase n=1 Tax=Bacillus cereus (strain ZK / E33L) TaxID=288681 RepID=Q4V169_BACCZ|nr:possible IS231-related transposase fragment [Bacillus cereus E33L]AJI26385.1 putative transposase for insertion sequence element IS231B [Bacillus cereus E33L]
MLRFSDFAVFTTNISKFTQPIFLFLKQDFNFDTHYFRRTRVLDTTHFQIPDTFAPTYQCSEGSGHNVGVKIQLEYDLLSD